LRKQRIRSAIEPLSKRPINHLDLPLVRRVIRIAFVGKHEPYRPLAEQIAKIISNTDPA
jgi:hypothetical protein